MFRTQYGHRVRDELFPQKPCLGNDCCKIFWVSVSCLPKSGWGPNWDSGSTGRPRLTYSFSVQATVPLPQSAAKVLSILGATLSGPFSVTSHSSLHSSGATLRQRSMGMPGLRQVHPGCRDPGCMCDLGREKLYRYMTVPHKDSLPSQS